MDGLAAGFSARSEERRCRPAFVRKGNLVRGRRGGPPPGPPVGPDVDGRRRDLALGRERKPGQVWGVGGPDRAKIWFALVMRVYVWRGRGERRKDLGDLVDFVFTLE